MKSTQYTHGLDELKIGDVLCDMYDFDRLNPQFRVSPKDGHRLTVTIITVAEVPLVGGTQCINQSILELTGELYSYTNKMLVVVDVTTEQFGCGPQTTVKAVWSYDGRKFGIMRIVFSEKPNKEV